MTLRGGGVETADGFLANTKAEIIFDMHADYGIKLNSRQRVVLIADVFNLLNEQNPTWYDVDVEAALGSLKPNFGQPVNWRQRQHQRVPDLAPDPTQRPVRVVGRKTAET